MSWVKLDDHFPIHRKTLEAGPLALAMNVAAICYCARELTDGMVKRSVLPTLIDLTWLPRKLVVTHQSLADRLVSAGAWQRADDETYEVHDYLAYNPSRTVVLQEREQAKVRMNTRRSSGEVRANTKPNTDRSSGTPVTPYPKVLSEPLAPNGAMAPKPEKVTDKKDRRKPETALPENFDELITEEDIEWARQQGFRDQEIVLETKRFRVKALAQDWRYRDWKQAWRQWFLQELKFRARAS